MRHLLLSTCLACAAACEPARASSPRVPAAPASADRSSEAPPPAAGTPPAAASTGAPAPAPSARRPLRAKLTGVITRSSMPVDGPAAGVEQALEICPGNRLRPCSGVRIEGELAPELISTTGHVVVARVTGRYNGARLVLEGPVEVEPMPPEPEYRNPCPEFQQARRGDANPSPSLQALAEQIEREHPERHAGTFWDRTRQSLTVRLTGDTSVIAAGLGIGKRPERLCLAGGAAHALHEQLAALDTIVQWLERERAWFVEGGPDVLSGELALRIENIDRAIRGEVQRLAGPGAHIETFIELLEGSLGELPEPPPRGDVPLVTQSRRWSYGGSHALGSFVVQLDEAARCVYLETERGERVLPIWPHGYAAYERPFRVVDFDGAVVSSTPEPQQFGGGFVPLDAFQQAPPNQCGATNAWVGTPGR